MTEGAEFPPVDLFGDKSKAWIGDGWHRIMAAKQIGAIDISTTLHEGGRKEALKHALSANSIQGQRRSNADKRRCVEIAIKEFPKLSSRAIAEMCGVGQELVLHARPQVNDSFTSSTVTGSDGKQYPARLESRKQEQDQEVKTKENPKLTKKEAAILPPSIGMWQAERAIRELEQIQKNDIERGKAFASVKGWIEQNE
jgi:hypothetical protein